MKNKFITILLSALLLIPVQAREYHVSSINGKLNGTGSLKSPFKTISQAAEAAYPGDIITVHEGTYREWVNPPRGGRNEQERIVYRAAPGEKVEIKGSELIRGWEKVKGQKGVWKVTIPNQFFGEYNPYIDLVSGDWFSNEGRIHHTGEVFLNEKSLYEKTSLEEVFHPVANEKIIDPQGSTYTWYCENEGQSTTIWANFHNFDPNKEQVEISVRKTCFYPEKTGIDYLTLQGFKISQAATQWGAPTAHQVGMVATNWNKGWIIEDNEICNAKCSGITLGKDKASGHNEWMKNPVIDGSVQYIQVTMNAVRTGWNSENVGHHVVRNNVIHDCEQTGICGSMGASFSHIENNHIYNIWTKRQFSGAEIGGIKFHAAIDAVIEHNCVHQAAKGIWLDWMTQGTRVSRNLFYDNSEYDIYLEVNHGPFLIDNNIMGSPMNVVDVSEGSAYAHNLFMGKLLTYPDGRYTPYFLPHSTDMAGVSSILGGDCRFYNNLFTDGKHANAADVPGTYGTAVYENRHYPVTIEDNAYMKNGQASSLDKHKFNYDEDADAKIIEKNDGIYLHIHLPEELYTAETEKVTTEKLGRTLLTDQRFENPDGSPLCVSKDWFGIQRNDRPVPGAFENIGTGDLELKLW